MPPSIPIRPWIPSSRGASAPLIAATFLNCCEPEAKGVIVLQGACTTATYVQCFFRILGASRTFNSWSSAPGIFLQPRILCRFFLCCWGRRVWVQISQRGKFWLQRRRARSASSFRSNHHCPDVNTLSQIANSIFLTAQTPRPRPSSPPSLGLTGGFGRGARGTKHKRVDSDDTTASQEP